jgi:hypothetical protein
MTAESVARRLRDAPRFSELTIFLSSGDDALQVRDRIESLVERVFNPQLRSHNAGFRFAIERWEREEAQRNAPGENTNERFVQMAREASVTVALLCERLGTGTREELEAVMNETNNDIAPLWFVPRDAAPESEVGLFLEQHRETLLHEKVGAPDSDESWEGVVRFLLSRTLDAMSVDPGTFREQR